ncbi:MAG: DNA gyrase inhibitor YacG [Planctomycetes bacterium]|nr:DNA gyrase inhibitor YacG [Planctomycetota bacterium]
MIRPTTCPICHKTLPPDAAKRSRFFPFCSERCRQIDFFRWTDGKYAIVEPLDPERISDEGSQIEKSDSAASDRPS